MRGAPFSQPLPPAQPQQLNAQPSAHASASRPVVSVHAAPAAASSALQPMAPRPQPQPAAIAAAAASSSSESAGPPKKRSRSEAKEEKLLLTLEAPSRYIHISPLLAQMSMQELLDQISYAAELQHQLNAAERQRNNAEQKMWKEHDARFAAENQLQLLQRQFEEMRADMTRLKNHNALVEWQAQSARADAAAKQQQLNRLHAELSHLRGVTFSQPQQARFHANQRASTFQSTAATAVHEHAQQLATSAAEEHAATMAALFAQNNTTEDEMEWIPRPAKALAKAETKEDEHDAFLVSYIATHQIISAKLAQGDFWTRTQRTNYETEAFAAGGRIMLRNAITLIPEIVKEQEKLKAK